MAVNGKQKGNSFERQIANFLSDRFKTTTGIEKSFRRNQDSGSFFGGNNKIRTEKYDLEHAVFGDLMCPKNFKFSIECKHYKSAPSFSSILKGDVKQWDTWLKQAEQDALNSGKLMMLVIKYNNTDKFIFLSFEPEVAKFVFRYKNYYGYRFSDIFELDDSNFFELP